MVGSAARWSMTQELVTEDDSWPAMRSAIIMCAISMSGTGVPSL